MTQYNCSYYDIDVSPLDPEDKNWQQCLQIKRQFANLTADLNVYDVYRRCLTPGASNTSSEEHSKRHLLGESIVGGEVK